MANVRANPKPTDMKLEVIIIPVADVDRSIQFYTGLGWRLDADITGPEFRGVQVTPPGSPCSVIFGRGNGFPSAGSRSAEGKFLVVSDLVAARAELQGRGVKVSEPVHGFGSQEPGLDPQRRSYFSFASFSDPDGNLWQLQEITQRLPGRVDITETKFSSAVELASALKRAETAHGEHEKKLGHRDENWPQWYAEFIVGEQSGKKQAA